MEEWISHDQWRRGWKKREQMEGSVAGKEWSISMGSKNKIIKKPTWCGSILVFAHKSPPFQVHSNCTADARACACTHTPALCRLARVVGAERRDRRTTPPRLQRQTRATTRVRMSALRGVALHQPAPKSSSNCGGAPPAGSRPFNQLYHWSMASTTEASVDLTKLISHQKIK